MIGLSLMVGIYSCKKDQAKPDGLINNESEMMKRSRKVVTLINEFKEDMNSDLKSGGSISLDSAVWNMEATLNYDYADPDSASALFITRKSVYTLDIDANEFSSLTDVQIVYDAMEDTLEMQFLDLINTVKIIVICDVSIDSTDANMAYLTLTNGFGLDLPTQYEPFDEDDDWIWGTLTDTLSGKCDSTMIGLSDGSNELQWRLNNPLLVAPEPIYGYTDVVINEAEGDEYFEDGNYRLYWDETGNADSCLTNERLTYYLWESDDIIHSYIANGGERPAGKDFIRVEIIDTMIAPTGASWFMHYYYISYGIPYYVPPPN